MTSSTAAGLGLDTFSPLGFYPSLADVQQVLARTGQLLTSRGWHKILRDQRLLTPFTQQEQELILAYWQERRDTDGVIQGAVLLSQNVFTRLTFHQIREQALGSLRCCTFEDEAAAAMWLRQPTA